MREKISAPIRRFAALAIAVLLMLVGNIVIVQPLTEAMKQRIDALADARFRLARMRAIAARKPDYSSNQLAAVEAQVATLPFRGDDIGQAALGLQAAVQSLAEKSGVQIEQINIVATASGRENREFGVSFVAHGSQKNMMQYLQVLAAFRPLIALDDWHITVDHDERDKLRISAIARGFWCPAEFQ